MNSELKWTTQQPAEHGLYWVYTIYAGEVILVDITIGGDDDGTSLACKFDDDRYYGATAHNWDDISHFMGPLRPPEPPKASA